jgi:hypothetical protein
MEIPGVATGVYAFYVEKWSLQGVRSIEKMNIEARESRTGSTPLEPEHAEKLITTAARLGKDWLSAANTEDIGAALESVKACISASRVRYERYTRQVNHENNDRADLQEKSLRAHLERQLSRQESLYDRQIAEGRESIARMTKGRIDSLKTKFEHKLRSITEGRVIKAQKREVCMGLIKVC